MTFGGVAGIADAVEQVASLPDPVGETIDRSERPNGLRLSRVRVPIGKPTSSLLVSDRAIGTDQGRKFVYVVNDANEVVFRSVELGARHEGLRVVSEGLKPGERVIIDGLQRVRPGSVVTAKLGDMRSRPSRSGGAGPAAEKSSGGGTGASKSGE